MYSPNRRSCRRRWDGTFRRPTDAHIGPCGGHRLVQGLVVLNRLVPGQDPAVRGENGRNRRTAALFKGGEGNGALDFGAELLVGNGELAPLIELQSKRDDPISGRLRNTATATVQ